MSVYRTIIEDGDWYLSVNVIHDDDPIRINYQPDQDGPIAEWYLSKAQLDELVDGLLEACLVHSVGKVSG